MAMNQDLPATDSATALHELIGEDSTATFENDPTFVGSTADASGSSENLQSPKDREDIRNSPSLQARDTDDVDEEDDEDEDDDEFEDIETEDEDDDEEDEEDLDDEDDLDDDDDDEDAEDEDE